ncbi:MAG TPA: hypothetical protein VK021_08355 [Flavobacteriaceae bacterium]|nr:hypothetical protein [Flavobacteriaceae bacterium]
METKKNKGFDTVKFARAQKEKLSAELAKMTKEDIVAYFTKVRLKSRIKPNTQ